MESTQHIIQRLIEKSAVAVLQIRTSAGEVRAQAPFVKEGVHEGDRGIWIRLACGDPGFIDRLIAVSTPVLVSADDGPRRISFVSCFLAKRKGLISGQQVLLTWPTDIKSQERRSSTRERIPPGSDISATLIGAPSTAFPRGTQPVQVWDLSTSGAALLCPAALARKFKSGDALHLQFRFAGAEHRVTAQICRTQSADGGMIRAGVAFTPGEGNDSINATLSQLVEELRSQRVRRGLNRALVKGA